MFRFLAIWALVLSSNLTAIAIAQGLTQEESTQVEKLVSNVVGICQAQALPQIKANAVAATSAGVPEWVNHVPSGDYCTCVGTRVRAGSTPEMERQGSEDDGQKLIRDSANFCAAKSFQESFPQICSAMLYEPSTSVPSGPISVDQQKAACSCIQARVNQISGDTLTPTIRDTVQDYVRWQRTPGEPASSSTYSMIHTYAQCFRSAGIERPRRD